ncbi:MAG: response regulator [Dehalococcoidia bacterium]
MTAYYQALPRQAEGNFTPGVFDVLTDAVLVADRRGRYIDANRAATALLGYSRDEFLQLSVADICSRGSGWATEEYEAFLKRGRWYDALEILGSDGSRIGVTARAQVVNFDDGPVYASLLTLTKPRIVVLDDDHAFLKLCRTILEPEGYECVTVRSAQDLREQLGQQVDLLTVDLRLDDEREGLDLIRALRSEGLQTPILVCSASLDLINRFGDEIEDLTCQVVSKPFDIDDLLAAIHRCLSS